MNGDIRPPRPRSQFSAPSLGAKRPLGQPVTSKAIPPVNPPTLPPIAQKPALPRRALSKKKLAAWTFAAIGLFLLIAGCAAYMWYQSMLQPADKTNSTKVRIQVVAGASTADIARILQEKKVIQSELAFVIYARLTGTYTRFKAGMYTIAPSESVPQIMKHLTSGTADVFRITFYPGATLEDYSAANTKKTDVRSQLRHAGYADAEITAAFKKQYDHPVFAGKPAAADLEGYIYGETYEFARGTSVEQILRRTFDEMYSSIEEGKLRAAFEEKGLNIYEAITLASIIQREVPTPQDQKQVAQVFLKRLSINMQLGSDVTYQYAAKVMGVAPTPELDSPYNTRRFEGLPPGPIASPGLTALQAVAEPAAGEYLYFLSGDDDVTYFASTEEEHTQNIKNHCAVKCSVF